MIASKPVRLLSLALVALVAVVGLQAISGGSPEPVNSSRERTVGVVAYVLDGDTVQVDLEGREVRVRLLGVNAPEVPHPGKSGDCYGKASMRQLEQLLPTGTQVTLVSDPSQDDIDTYGRLLRYVQAESRDVGAAQIRAGSASARDISGASNPARHTSYVQLEARARDHGRGMWTACA